jgi:heterodisulfide reductase subunit A
MCKERMGVAAIGIFNRGADRYVATPYEEISEVCRSCGACATVCPTGCIDFKTYGRDTPAPLLSRWNEGTRTRKAVSIAFEQAVPKIPTIDREACVHLNTGACGVCADLCVAKAIDFEQNDEEVELEVGSIIVATGFQALDPTPLKHLGYGAYPNVFTNLEFERLSNATGPTGGALLMRDPENRFKFTEPPQSVAILHCIGSRDVNYHEYCSRTCCMYALKYAHLLKDKVGHDVQVFNFYIDMRCFGKGYEEFYRRVQSEGVRMIRGKATRVTDHAESDEEQGKLVVVAEDTLSRQLLRVPVDMVILCTAMEPQKDAIDVSRVFGISIGSDGFFLEEHPKLEPVSTATSGVFLAGACQGPKDIPDSVAQAKAAASMAQALTSLGEVAVAPMISGIDADICVGCQVCIGLCPYSAIEFDARHGVSVVNSAVCKGCGSCAAYCPSGAAKISHFTDRQVFAEIEGLLAAAGSQ